MIIITRSDPRGESKKEPAAQSGHQRYHLPKNFRSPEIGADLPILQIQISGDFDKNESKSLEI
jgi:hypothetical protein